MKSRFLTFFGVISGIVLLIFAFVFYYYFKTSVELRLRSELSYKASKILDNYIHKKPLDFDNFAIYKDNQLIIKKGKFYKIDKQFRLFLNGETLDSAYRYKFATPFVGEVYVAFLKVDSKIEDIQDILLVFIPLLYLVLMGVLYNLLNKIDYLEEGIKRVDRFNSDLSHEFKTPLTIINGKVDLCLKKDRDMEYYKKNLKIIKTQIAKLQDLIHNLLLIAKYDKKTVKNSFCEVDVVGILLPLVENIKNVELDIDRCILNSNPFILETIFSNLINNAVKFTPKDKKIYISLHCKTGLYFMIKDEGIGIKSDEVDRVMDRFYRSDTSRHTEGFGLGLSIVKSFVKLLGGELKINSEYQKGATIEIIL